jgi:predicted enzyme related to lactoylglutathione lyase
VEAFIRNVTFDAARPDELARFWAGALGWLQDGTRVESPSGGAPRLNFEPVEDPKLGKNRVHLDVNVDDREAHVQRLVGLGATKVADVDDEGGEYGWTVMQDPEGNEFCVVALEPL